MTGTGLGFTHRFEAGDPDRPTLLLLHGTGGNEDDLIPIGRGLAPGAALLSPRGPVLEHGMPRFFRRLAAGVFDEDDLVARTRELARFLGAAAAQYGFDPARVVAVGYSNGANIAASLLFLEPRALAGAALFRAMTPLVPPSPPDLRAIPVLLSSGRDDPYGPGAEDLSRRLEEYGAIVDFHRVEAGHELVPEDLALARGWLGRFALPA